jgi:hypothetical protein
LGGAGDVMMAAGAVIPPALPAATALGAALKAPRATRVAASSAPALAPAIRGGGKIFKGDVGETHLDVLDAIEDKQLASRLLSDADNRGFVTEKGKFLSRDRAVDYALQNDLVDPDFASYYRPDQYSELIADHLKKPSSVDPNQAAGAARLSRAKEQGFDVDNPVYHGTNAETLTAFDESKIGSATDSGFYGRGIYFASTPGEARYYGQNVDEYVVRGDFLDLTNTTGDYTLGGPVKFIQWAEKLDEIGALDDFTKDGLAGAKKLVKYFDENVKFNPGQNADGTTGVYAQIVDPTRKPQIFKGKEYPETVDLRVDARGFFAKDEAEAKERLFDQFAYQMKTSTYKDIDYFKGWNDDFYTSLSDYVRVGPIGSAELTKKAKAAGFDGIKADDETVVFDPKNIRRTDAEFDPEKTESPDLLSSLSVEQPVYG